MNGSQLAGVILIRHELLAGVGSEQVLCLSFTNRTINIISFPTLVMVTILYLRTGIAYAAIALISICNRRHWLYLSTIWAILFCSALFCMEYYYLKK